MDDVDPRLSTHQTSRWTVLLYAPMRSVHPSFAHWRRAGKHTSETTMLFIISRRFIGRMQILIDATFVRQKKFEMGNRKWVNVLLVKCIGVFLKIVPLNHERFQVWRLTKHV